MNKEPIRHIHIRLPNSLFKRLQYKVIIKEDKKLNEAMLKIIEDYVSDCSVDDIKEYVNA